MDAIAIHETDSSRSRTDGKVNELLELYQGKRSLLQYSILGQNLLPDDILSMVTFHLTIAKPLVQQYSDWILTSLAKEAERQSLD